MDRNEAASGLAEALWSTEKALDGAFGELAALLGVATRARQDGEWGMAVGQDAINEIALAIPEMTAVRDRLIEAHRRLGRWQRRMGVDALRMGGGGDKPGDDGVAPGEVAVVRPPLRSVA